MLHIPRRAQRALLLAAAAVLAASTITGHLPNLTNPNSAFSFANRSTPASDRIVADALGTAIPTAPPTPVATAPDTSQAREAPTMTPPPRRPQISGIASHYPGTRGFIGRAVVALPGALGGHYTGGISGTVTVCADRCVTLPVVDWCQCYWGTSRQRVADLSPQAWALVTDLPLSRGLVKVTVILN